MNITDFAELKMRACCRKLAHDPEARDSFLTCLLAALALLDSDDSLGEFLGLDPSGTSVFGLAFGRGYCLLHTRGPAGAVFDLCLYRDT